MADVSGADAKLGAPLGELYWRLFPIHCDTHVDPPAFAVVLFRLLLGAVQPRRRSHPR